MLRTSVIFVDTLAGDLSMAARAPPFVSSGGSAVRRRERRLRSFWRHEQMAVQMALATVTHHSFQVGTAHDALRSQKPVTSAGGMRPPPLFEGRPQVRVQRHTVEQRIEHTPYLQILDAPVPQKVEQLVDSFKDLDSHVPVQVIEVPKISQDIIPQRSVDLVPQRVKQLVEVPTVLTPTRIAVQIAEQIVGIPVPHGRHGRLPGFLPGQGSTASAAEQISDILSSSGDFQGFRPRQSSTAVSEQNVSTPAPCRGGLRGGLHGFPSVQGSAVDFPVPLGDADEGFFRTFPRPKKSAKVRARSMSELAAHSSPSTPGANGVVSSLEEPVQEENEEHQVSPMPDSIEWVELCDDKGKTHFWNRRSNETAWNPPEGIKVVWVGTKDSKTRSRVPARTSSLLCLQGEGTTE